MDKRYDELELTILAHLLLYPKDMENTRLEDKHFKNRKAIWVYMKTFYSKFKTFDLSLMCSFSKSKNKILDMIMGLMEYAPEPNHFKLYENRLIEMYMQEEKEKKEIDYYYELATNLILEKIKLEDYKEEIKRRITEDEKTVYRTNK